MGSENLLGAFEEMVLLAVARGAGDAYGMTVRREIEERTGREVTIGAVYATLDRLEKKGLLTSRLGDGGAERRGRARRHFRLRTRGPRRSRGLSRCARVYGRAWRSRT